MILVAFQANFKCFRQTKHNPDGCDRGRETVGWSPMKGMLNGRYADLEGTQLQLTSGFDRNNQVEPIMVKRIFCVRTIPDINDLQICIKSK